jgi:hypothetical protein
MEKSYIPKSLYEDMKKVRKIRVVVEPWRDDNKGATLKVRIPGINLVVAHNPPRTESQLKKIIEGHCSRCYIFPTKGRTPDLLKKIDSEIKRLKDARIQVNYEVSDDFEFLTVIVAQTR